MGIYLSDNDNDCLTNLRFADDVLLFASSKEQLQKMLYEFKKSTEKVGLRIHPEKTKILSNQSLDTTKKKLKSITYKVELLKRGESARYLGQIITFLLQETTEIRNRIRAAWANISRVQAGTGIDKLRAQTSTLAIRRSDNSDDMLRIGNMDTHQRARENDTVDATQNAPTHHANKEKIQKDRETRRQDQRRKRHQ